MKQSSGTFFCYSRSDSDFALRLAQDLRDEGVEIWIDQLDIPAGAAWDRTIEQAISSCGRLLVVLSPHSVASENVMDEVSFALDQGDLVIPVLLSACDVPLRIRRLQYIDFTGSYDEGLAKLTQAFASSAPSDSAEAAAAAATEPEPGTTPIPASPGGKPALKRRTGLIIAIAAVLALAVAFGLTRNPKTRTRDSRRQTATQGSGIVAIPSVIGVAQDRALAALARQNLKPTVVGTRESCSKPAGSVLKQEPAGMTQAKAGSEVRLVIAQRTPIPIPDRAANLSVLAPGAGEAGPGRERRRTQVGFQLAGDPCSTGTVTVTHPTAGREVYQLKAGERGERNIVYGSGKIVVQFESLNRDARLVVRID